MGKYISRSRIEELLGTPPAPGVEIGFGPITTKIRDRFECQLRQTVAIHCDPDVLIKTANKNKELMETLAEITQKIDNGELAEVIHGRWVFKTVLRYNHKLQRYARTLEMRCSVCDTENHRKTKHCPECGARMDGDSNA